MVDYIQLGLVDLTQRLVLDIGIDLFKKLFELISAAF